jgi:hypothetical protein
MNYVNFVKNIPNIKNVRSEQLERQNQTDVELKKLNDTCPDIVAEYLLFQRQLSRIQQKEMIDSSIIGMVDVLYKHFDENNNIYNDFFKIIECENPCECLKKLMRS